MNRNHLHILDEFLKVLKDTEPRQRAFTSLQVQDFFYKRNPDLEKGWSNDLTDEVIAKLIKDEFVRIDTKYYENTPIGKGNISYYIITIEGLIFIDSVGGYVKQKEIEDLKKQEIINDLILRKRNDHRLVIGTFLVAVAGLGLIIWEMYQAFFLHHR